MANTAFIIMDMQNGVVERYGAVSEPVVAAIARAGAAARAAGLPVVYIRIAFRAGTPEISPRNRVFAAIASSGWLADGQPATEIHPALAPQDGDIVVTKKRISAFAGSDLHLLLRSMNVDSLVLTGIATSGVVLSTVREAADLDYRLTVLSDCCADGDIEVHRTLLEKVFPLQADVRVSEDWIKESTIEASSARD